uniref:Integrin beta n=1 Tax=Hemiscolopendra marginata TaxID=943146 RepID=A0A646QHC7_9MYRI
MNPYPLLFSLGFLIIFPIFISNEKTARDSREELSKECTRQKTCSSCIRFHPECAWCSEPDYDKDRKPRCDVRENLGTEGRCLRDHIVFPENEDRIVKSEKLSEPGADLDSIVQIAPQEINLALRPNQSFPLSFQFRQAEDYPLDLYYLMDLSKSMEDDKDKLAQLGDLLAEKMSNITKNFRLGFGSFVDKTVMPYVSTVPKKLLEPCTNCAAPYGFKNHMSLDLKTRRFKEEVAMARVSGNLDAPEGGFDAIMQAIVCREKIGWRDISRKLLVFSTDSGFHYAGDGKLGGIVKPNDGECHMDDDGYYTESITQDYPSLSQINQKTIEKKIHMIFAVTSSQVPIYERLSQNLVGSTTGKLEDDSSNVVELIKNQYEKITSSVEITVQNASEYIDVTFYSQCLSGYTQETNICTGLKVGNTVSFTAQIKVKNCPKNKDEWKQTFTISPVGIGEKIVVNLDMLCECECEDYYHEERNSDKCTHGNGTYECGICDCYTNRQGKYCECDSEDGDFPENHTNCIEPNTGLICSDRGRCVCAECVCNYTPFANYTGQYCECDDSACNFHYGKLCNDKGTCKCGECVCEDDWTGPACECYNSTAPCIEKGSGKVCGDHGVCYCGKCICNVAADKHYFGEFCSECTDCEPQKCEDYKPCVQCRAFQSGPYTAEECDANCIPPPEIELVDEAKVENSTYEKSCVFVDDDDCKFTFVYGFYNDSSPYIHVQRTKDCPPPLNILMIVLGVIIGIVAIGLCLLLIWKLLTTIHDRREFAKFEKERQMAKWDTGENPIFKQATSTFKNPTYGGK